MAQLLQECVHYVNMSCHEDFRTTVTTYVYNITAVLMYSLVPRLPPCFYLACSKKKLSTAGEIKARGKPGNEDSVDACTHVHAVCIATMMCF